MIKEKLAIEFLLLMNDKPLKGIYAKEIDYKIDPKWAEFGLYEF